jgi:cellulose synthase/poly-beta-1,6-N-acetylglucosamine synthase-like glycosyltransferase
MKNYFVSIVVSFKKMDNYVQECLEHCLSLDYDNFEIILLPDQVLEEFKFIDKRIKIIPTGPVKPSVKRNIAIKESKAEIIAFVDSDAYPVSNWLSNALVYFDNEQVGGVGGPNLTPPNDTIWQKASGDIFSSLIGAGAFALRYKARYTLRKYLPVKEMPSCNLLVRRNLAQAINGFDTALLTGEDAKFCFQIRKLGKKIIYVPEVIVYHHRRFLFRPHLKQVWIYGRDKAWILKEDFSLDKLYYFIPASFLIFVSFGFILSFFDVYFRYAYLLILIFYLILVIVFSLAKGLKRFFLILPGIILTHFSYGLGFIYGLLNKKR